MKLLLLAICVALAAGRSINEQTFRTEHEYVYQYEGQALTGIPRSSEYYSGLKVKAIVRLHFLSNGKNVAMKMENIELYMLNGKVMSPEQLEQPEKLFQRISGQEEQEMILHLSKPVVFSYQQGLVEELKVEADEPHWSVNTKRGIVNLFIVNLQERRLIEEEESPLRESTSQHAYFRSMEKGVLGECEAVYEVLEGQWQGRMAGEHDNVINVTKVYNMTNCLHKPVYQQNVFNSQACPRCHEEQPELIETGSQIRFNISGNRQQFMIESVIAESQHVFTPYREHAGSIVTFINQTMYLIQAGEKTKTIEQPQQPISKPIFMEIPELFEQYYWLFEQTPKRDSRPVIPTAEIISLVRKIEEELKKPELQIEVPTHIMRLVSVLRELYPEQLRELYTQSKSQLLFDVLPFIGTRPAIQLVLDIIERQERNPEWCAEALQAVAHFGYPTEKIIDQLIRIAEKSPRQQIQRTAWLTVGSLLFQLVQIPEYHLNKPLPLEHNQWIKIQQRLNQLHEKYAEVFTQHLLKSENEDYKVVVLKAIGNAGLLRTMPILKKIIYQKEQPLRVRVFAVIALRRIAPIMPEEVMNILLPIFKNQMIDPELRIVAFEIMLACKPELTTFQLFSQWLHREQNKQVGSYVFSTLRTLANSTHPCYKRIAHHARIALRFGTPIRPGMLYSKNWHYSYMNEKLQLGGFLELKTVGQKESVIPKWIVGKFNTQIFGKSLDAFEFGVRAQGIQSLVDRMFNKYSKEQTDLPIKPRHFAEPKVGVYVKLFGNEHRFWTFDREYLQRLVQKNAPIQQFYERMLQRPFEFTKTFMVVDGVVKIPTLLGMPLSLNVTSVAVLRVEGKMEEARFERSSKQLIVGGEIKPKIVFEIEGRMGIDATLIKTGTAIKARINTHMPINGKLMIDVVNMQAKFVTEKIEQPELRIVEAEIRPINFIEMPRRIVKEEPIEFVIKGAKINPVQTRERVFGERATGMQFTLKREFTPRNFTRFAPFHPLTGRQYFTVLCRPTTQSPKQLEMTLQYSKKAVDGPVSSMEAFSDEQKAFSSEEEEQDQRKQARYSLKWEEFEASDSSSSSSSSSESDSESDEVYTTKKPIRGMLRGLFRSNPDNGDDDDDDTDDEPTRRTQDERSRRTQDERIRRVEDERIRRVEDERIRRTQEEPTRRTQDERIRRVEDERRRIQDEPTRRFQDERTRRFQDEPIRRIEEDSSSSSESDSSSSSSSSSSESQSSESSSSESQSSESWEHAKLKMQPKKFYQQKFESKTVQHRVAFALRTVGGIRRELTSEFAWTYDQSFSEHQFQWIFERTPIRTSEKENWQLYFKGQMSVPRFTGKWTELPQDIRGHGLFQFQWGQKSQTKKTFAITINTQRSPDQLKAIQGVSNQQWYTNLKRQCQQDKQTGMEYSESCYDAMLFESTLNQVLIQIDYQREQLPRWFYHYSQVAMRFAYGKLWRHARVMDTVSNAPNTFRMMFTVSNDQRMADIVFKMPRMNLMFKRIPLFTPIYPMVVRRPAMYYFLQRITGDNFKPFCKVMNKEVRTFDNVTFFLPEETQNCEVVLSKDCSEKQRYTITMLQQAREKFIRIIADRTEIKIRRISPQHFECDIEGKTFQLAVGEMKVHEKPLQHTTQYFRMEQTESSFVIRVKPTGLTVFFDGENIMIEASNMYRYKQCGICGDFNGEESYEFVGPQEEIYTDEKHFTMSYVLPSSKCNAPRTYKAHSFQLPKF